MATDQHFPSAVDPPGDRLSDDGSVSPVGESVVAQLEEAFEPFDIELPSISFCYCEGVELVPKQTNSVLLLSGAEASAVKSFPSGDGAITTTTDISNSLMFHPEHFNRVLGQGQPLFDTNGSKMKAYRAAISDLALEKKPLAVSNTQMPVATGVATGAGDAAKYTVEDGGFRLLGLGSGQNPELYAHLDLAAGPLAPTPWIPPARVNQLLTDSMDEEIAETAIVVHEHAPTTTTTTTMPTAEASSSSMSIVVASEGASESMDGINIHSHPAEKRPALDANIVDEQSANKKNAAAAEATSVDISSSSKRYRYRENKNDDDGDLEDSLLQTQPTPKQPKYTDLTSWFPSATDPFLQSSNEEFPSFSIGQPPT